MSYGYGIDSSRNYYIVKLYYNIYVCKIHAYQSLYVLCAVSIGMGNLRIVT